MRHGFSIDVEDWYHVENLAPYIPRTAWNACESRVERNVNVLLDLLHEHKTKVTCFVLGDVARRFPHIVRAIASAGHEVASHGEDHRLVYDLTPAEFQSSVSDLRSYLEDLSGTPVRGYRAPCFTIVRRSWWALDVLAECGYEYDASIIPFERGRYGVAGAPLNPHILALASGRRIKELPPSVLPLCGLSLPIAGGGYFRLYPYWFSRWAIGRLEQADRAYFFYMHPWEIDPDQPRVARMSMKARFLHFHHLKDMPGRVRRLLSDFEFTTYANLMTERPIE